MIQECKQCGIKYEDQTAGRCPICFFTLKEEREQYRHPAINFMLSEVRGLRKMVSMSVKGTHRRSPKGMRLIDPYCGHRSKNYIFNKNIPTIWQPK